ncbi:MAG: hypothetical protein E7262_02370 [Lachnospiraceae bacterium]|nr:hypothetical protein [Lachnospiraceae bacterium]
MKKINNKQLVKKYPIDSAGVIHMASLTKHYANTFRIAITMKERVDKEILQEAFNDVRGRFPTIVAGIRKGVCNYYLVPAFNNVEVEHDDGILKPLSRERVKNCAMKVLYRDNKISIEIFHTITDGTGGSVFTKTLIARYIELKYSNNIDYTEDILNYKDDIKEYEIRDEYMVHAGEKTTPANKELVYRIPGKCCKDDEHEVIVHRYNTSDLLEKSHKYHTTLTNFLTATMVETIFSIQNNGDVTENGSRYKDIQIMVPINLRKIFKSNTLYNFTLFALPKFNKEDKNKTLQELINKAADQLKQQGSKDNLKKMMATNVRSQNMFLMKYMPLFIKENLLKIVYKVFGERNSCISVSNFGEFKIPDSMAEHISDIEFILTPRRNASYNCSLISYNGYTNISISKKGYGCGLEEIFHNCIEQA